MLRRLDTFNTALDAFAPIDECFSAADARAKEEGVQDLGGEALRVMQMGADVSALEKQYATLDKWNGKENALSTDSSAAPSEKRPHALD